MQTLIDLRILSTETNASKIIIKNSLLITATNPEECCTPNEAERNGLHLPDSDNPKVLFTKHYNILIEKHILKCNILKIKKI